MEAANRNNNQTNMLNMPKYLISLTPTPHSLSSIPHSLFSIFQQMLQYK